MQVLLVTGGGSGIGEACGIEFLQKNLNNCVSFVDKRFENSNRQNILTKFGEQRVLFVVADVTKRDQIYQAFEQTAQKFQRLDIVLNNAGTGTDEKIVSTDRQSLERYFDKLTMVIDVNLIAVIKVTMLAVQFMLKLNSPGQIINVSSMGGIYPQGDVPTYSASKHGVIGFSRSLNYLKNEYNISVNVMCPTFIDTPLVRNAIKQATKQECLAGQLVDVGIALPVESCVKAFFDLVELRNNQTGYVQSVTNQGIFQIKYPQVPKLPGESQRGGMLKRVPSKLEVQQFFQKFSDIKNEKKSKL